MIVDITITATFDDASVESVYEHPTFQAGYEGSSIDTSGSGADFDLDDLVLRRTDGWPGTSVEFEITVEDDVTGITTETFLWQLPAPEVNIEPGTASGADAAAGRVSQFDVRLDPLTGDLVDDGAGAVEMVTTAETAVLLQLITHHDAWCLDAEAGSRIHNLDTFARDPEALLEDEARRALDVLVAAGVIADVDVHVTESAPGRVDVVTSFRDVKTGSAVTLAIPASGA